MKRIKTYSIFHGILHEICEMITGCSALHRGFSSFCCALHKNYYNYPDILDSGTIMVYTVSTIMIWRYTAMLKTPELAMPRSRKVTTVCNGKREVWTDYEQAKAYFLEMMMSIESYPA